MNRPKIEVLLRRVLFWKEMLFNLKDDPHEQNNTAGEEELIRLQGAKHLLD